MLILHRQRDVPSKAVTMLRDECERLDREIAALRTLITSSS
jgi:hypothetical protein